MSAENSSPVTPLIRTSPTAVNMSVQQTSDYPRCMLPTPDHQMGIHHYMYAHSYTIWKATKWHPLQPSLAHTNTVYESLQQC